MKLRYLGTAAAEGIPALFCRCPICQNAHEKKGKEIKTRSQALVDDCLLIDFPPDTYMHMLNYGLDLPSIKYCIITHSHLDHLLVTDFWCRLPGIAHGIDEEPMHIYLTESGYKKALDYHGENIDCTRLKFHKIKAFEPFDVENYHITPIRATHDPNSDPVIYLIESEGKALLYANDTGILSDESLEFIKKLGVRIDFVSIDCTAMLLTGWRDGHMGLDTNQEFMASLYEMGVCDEKTTVYVNHFSHNGLATHEKLVEEAAKLGYGASYDGLEVEF